MAQLLLKLTLLELNGGSARMELTQAEIKLRMNMWVVSHISDCRKQNQKMNRAMLATRLGVTSSCFCQYLNHLHPKAAPWEFRIKLAELLHKSLRELHPELIDLSLEYAA